MGIKETLGLNKKEVSPDKVESVYHAGGSVELSRLWSDPAILFDELEHYLRMHEYTKDGWVDTGEKALINKYGWRVIKAAMQTVINPINLTSQLSEQKIADLTVLFARTIGHAFAVNYKIWEVSPKDVPLLINQLSIFFHMALSKTREGRDGVGIFLDRSSGMSRETYTMQGNQGAKPNTQFVGLGI